MNSELHKYRKSDPKRRTQRIDKISETQCKCFQVFTTFGDNIQTNDYLIEVWVQT